MRINNSFVLLEVEKLLPVTKLIFLYGFITVTYLGLLSLYLKVLSNGTNGGGREWYHSIRLDKLYSRQYV